MDKDLQEVNCLCGSQRVELKFIKHSLPIKECLDCGLVYVSPRLSESQLKELYNRNLLSHFDDSLDSVKSDTIVFNKLLDYIENYIKPGRLLDVGCGVGTLLNVARTRGWEASGIDINQNAVDHCALNLGLKVKSGIVEETSFKANSFDVIVMNHYLEHLPDPMKTLKIVHNILVDDGFIFIVTPDIDSFMAKVSGSKWIHIKPEAHLYYFTGKTIGHILHQSGFEVIKKISFSQRRTLGTIVTKIETYNKNISKILKNIIKIFAVEKKSINLSLGDIMLVISQKIESKR